MEILTKREQRDCGVESSDVNVNNDGEEVAFLKDLQPDPGEFDK